jgi:hypothetical protein
MLGQGAGGTEELPALSGKEELILARLDRAREGGCSKTSWSILAWAVSLALVALASEIMLMQMHSRRYARKQVEMIAPPMTTWLQLWVWQNFPSWMKYLYV